MKNWTCPKCGFTGYEQDEIRATGGMLSKIFNVQNKRFTTISCRKCKYTELYKAESSVAGDILDLFMN